MQSSKLYAILSMLAMAHVAPLAVRDEQTPTPAPPADSKNAEDNKSAGATTAAADPSSTSTNPAAPGTSSSAVSGSREADKGRPVDQAASHRTNGATASAPAPVEPSGVSKPALDPADALITVSLGDGASLHDVKAVYGMESHKPMFPWWIDKSNYSKDERDFQKWKAVQSCTSVSR